MRRDDQAAEDASEAGLVYTTDQDPGFSRKRQGRGWSFLNLCGAPIKDPKVRKRCLALAIPPAYRKVWICPNPRGHLQATGRDAKDRKVYLYHPAWRRLRDQKKYAALPAFGRKLGRARLRNDEARQGLSPHRLRVLAALVFVLDQHALRIGKEAYTEDNGSFGASTLRQDHWHEDKRTLHFRAKHGQERHVPITDRRLLRFVRRLSDLPGQHLFQYKDDDGTLHPLSSSDVNAYLAGLFGENATAKIFRTWHGSSAAFTAGLNGKAGVEEIAAAAAKKLGNTKAIARSSYIHPAIIEAVKDRRLTKEAQDLRGGRPRQGLSAEETLFLRWLERQAPKET